MILSCKTFLITAAIAAIAIACSPDPQSSPTTAVPEAVSPNSLKPIQVQKTPEYQSVKPQEPSQTRTTSPPATHEPTPKHTTKPPATQTTEQTTEPPKYPDLNPAIASNLQRKIERYYKKKTEHDRTNQTMNPVFVIVAVIVKDTDHVHEAIEFIEEHSTGWTAWNKGNETTLPDGAASGRVNIELVSTIADLPGVIEVYEIIPDRGSSNPEPETCDTTLRSALVTRRGTDRAEQVNSIILAIQTQRAVDCNQSIWNPSVGHNSIQPSETAESPLAHTSDGCGITSNNTPAHITIGKTEIPKTLLSTVRIRIHKNIYNGFAHDDEGNIIVEFDTSRRPYDGSNCWLYIKRSNYWDRKE